MSATREYRNATLVEEALQGAAQALKTAERLYSMLAQAGVLPDDMPSLDDEFNAANQAIEELQEATA